MKILADESLDGPVVAWLRSINHDVTSAAEISPGESDANIVNQARRDGRVILTSDRDIGELVFRHGARPPGIALLRLRAKSAASFLDAFQRQWPLIEANILNHFLVVGRDRVRARPL